MLQTTYLQGKNYSYTNIGADFVGPERLKTLNILALMLIQPRAISIIQKSVLVCQSDYYITAYFIHFGVLKCITLHHRKKKPSTSGAMPETPLALPDPPVGCRRGKLLLQTPLLQLSKWMSPLQYFMQVDAHLHRVLH